METTIQSSIKEACKRSRNRMGLTNQDIADLISERFGIEDFSVNTVNNFFSDRSKATTIFTAGYICAVLDVSIDAEFGIDNPLTSPKEREYIEKLNEVRSENRLMDELLKEKETRIAQAHVALEHYRKINKRNSKVVPSWMCNILLVFSFLLVVFIIGYLVFFDIGNSAYGIFTH